MSEVPEGMALVSVPVAEVCEYLMDRRTGFTWAERSKCGEPARYVYAVVNPADLPHRVVTYSACLFHLRHLAADLIAEDFELVSAGEICTCDDC